MGVLSEQPDLFKKYIDLPHGEPQNCYYTILSRGMYSLKIVVRSKMNPVAKLARISPMN